MDNFILGWFNIMVTLSSIMLEAKFNGQHSIHGNGQNFNTWKQWMLAIFEYRCLDKLISGKEIWNETDKDSQVKYHAKNREVVILIKLFVMDEMLLEVQTGDNAFTIW